MTFEEVGENNVGLRNHYSFLNIIYFNRRYVILKDGVPVAEEEFGFRPTVSRVNTVRSISLISVT